MSIPLPSHPTPAPVPIPVSFRPRRSAAALCALSAGLLLAACGERAPADDAAPVPPVIAQQRPADEVLQGAHVPTLDPSTLNDAEIRKVLGTGAQPRCTFRYTSTGKPVLVTALAADGSAERAVLKLNGSLLALRPAPAATGVGAAGFHFQDGPVKAQVYDPQAGRAGPPAGRQVEAEMLFEVSEALKVGYGGYLACGPR